MLMNSFVSDSQNIQQKLIGNYNFFKENNDSNLIFNSYNFSFNCQNTLGDSSDSSFNNFLVSDKGWNPFFYGPLVTEPEPMFENTPLEIQIIDSGNKILFEGGEILEIANFKDKINKNKTEKPLGKNYKKSYRAERDEIKKNKKLVEEEIFWNKTPPVNYPYNKIKVPIGDKKAEKIKKNNVKDLKFLHWNANGIVGKVNEIENLIREFDPDIISLNETKTNPVTEMYIYELARLGYFPWIKSRKKLIVTNENDIEEEDSQGGGVALFVRDSIKCEKIEIPDRFGHLETIGVQIKIGSSFLSIFTWYIPPKENLNVEFMSYIEGHGDFIILGDLNARMSKIDSKTNDKGRVLEKLLQSFKGDVVNKNCPTFYMYQKGNLISASTLDLVICGESMRKNLAYFEALEISPVFNEKASYFHLPIMCSFGIGVRPRKARNSFHSSFIYSRADWRSFSNELDRELIDDIESTLLEVLNNRIINAYIKAAGSSIPKSKEKLSREINFPPEIVSALKNRNYWGKMFRRWRNEETADRYKYWEVVANEKIADFKQSQWQEFLKKQGPHPLSSVPFWKRINRLREAKRAKRIATILVDGKEYKESMEKATLFADSLEKKFKLDANPLFNDEKKRQIDDFLKNKFEDKFENHQKIVKEFTMIELINSIKNMNSKTSLDPFGLSNKMFKFSSQIAKEKILALFNQCLREKRVPDNWKTSVVSMLLKQGQEASGLNSYRPISMTPCLARLFERMILARLQQHLKKNNILITNQSGFRKARQTKDNLLTLIQGAQEGFNRCEKTLAIFFDVAAAFDKVWHGGLIYKLFLIKVPYYLIMVIWDFLKDRKFMVKIDNCFSEKRDIECGVPQGGVLSPTLFSIYINDIPIAANNKERTLLFADDIVYTLSYVFKENGRLLEDAKEIAEEKAQIYLDLLAKWMCANFK
jgi:hypothetical protein